MMKQHWFKTALAATTFISLGATVQAQFTAPAPLAWRWVGSLSTAQPISNPRTGGGAPGGGFPGGGGGRGNFGGAGGGFPGAGGQNGAGNGGFQNGSAQSNFSLSLASVPTGSPLVDGSAVYLSMGERLYALDLQTGNQLWRFPREIANAGVFRSMPILMGSTLIAISENHYAYAVDEATGVIKWSHFFTKSPLGQPIPIGDKLVAFELSDNSFDALDLETGASAIAEPIKVEGQIQGSPVGYRDSVLYFNSASQLVSLNLLTQKVAWMIPFVFADASVKPIVSGDTVYIASGNYLAAVNAASGRGKWQIDVQQPIAFPPAVSARSIVVFTRDGKMMTIDLLRGRPLFREPIETGIVPIAQASPMGEREITETTKMFSAMSFEDEETKKPQKAPTAGTGDIFAVPGGNGSVNLINVRSGDILWSFVMKPSVPPEIVAGRRSVDYTLAAGPAVLAGKSMLVVTKDGSLLSFDADNGIDLTPPTAKLLQPSPGETLSGQPPLTLVFSVEDEASGLNENSVQILLDDKPVAFSKSRENYFLVRVSSTGKVKPIADGRHKFTVIAEDWLGNSGKTDFYLNIDNTLRPGIPNSEVLPNNNGNGGGPGGGGGRGRG